MKKRGVLKEIIITFLMLLLVFAIFELIFYVNTGREFFASLSRPEMVVVPFLLQNLLYVVLGFAGLFLIIFSSRRFWRSFSANANAILSCGILHSGSTINLKFAGSRLPLFLV